MALLASSRCFNTFPNFFFWGGFLPPSVRIGFQICSLFFFFFF
jgi:hypothetical protein